MTVSRYFPGTLLVAAVLLASSCVRVDAQARKQAESADGQAAQPARTDDAPRPAANKPGQDEPVQNSTAQSQSASRPQSPPAPQQVVSVATADAQNETAPPTVAQRTATQPAATPAATDQRTKQEILHSREWRRAMFEFNEWLSAQQIYTPEQVAQIKDQFNHRVAAMDAREVSYLLADMEEKFQIINTPQAVEARAWMAQYLSVMSDRKRAEVLKDMPNIATMTAAQLNAEIQRIIEKRQTMDSEQAAFQRGQAMQVANQLQTDRINQQNFVRDWNSGPTTLSPYRSQSNVNQRLNNTPTGAGMGFYVGPMGGVGMTFAPSSW